MEEARTELAEVERGAARRRESLESRLARAQEEAAAREEGEARALAELREARRQLASEEVPSGASVGADARGATAAAPMVPSLPTWRRPDHPPWLLRRP